MFAQAIRRFREVIRECLEANKISIDEVDHFLFHQANKRILDAVADSLNIPAAKVPVNIHKYGNTSAASVPILLHESCRKAASSAATCALLAAFGLVLTGCLTLAVVSSTVLERPGSSPLPAGEGWVRGLRCSLMTTHIPAPQHETHQAFSIVRSSTQYAMRK